MRTQTSEHIAVISFHVTFCLLVTLRCTRLTPRSYCMSPVLTGASRYTCQRLLVCFGHLCLPAQLLYTYVNCIIY